MARRNRDLAGLAALGALGYMATRGKDIPVEDRRGTPVTQDVDRPDDRDIGMISGASPSGLYRNTESGDLFSMNRPDEEAPTSTPARPAATRPAATRPAATNRSMAGPRRNVAGDYTRKAGATAEEIAAYNRAQETAGSAAKPRGSVVQASTQIDRRPDLSTPEGRKRAEQEQALERVTPEEYLVGGPGLKTLHTLAKGLANRPVRQLALPAPAVRPEVRGAGEGFVMYKKGGAVKAKKMASGGSTSSASSRADGIASRGKTKCKMY